MQMTRSDRHGRRATSASTPATHPFNAISDERPGQRQAAALMRVVMSRAGAGPPGVGLPERGALHRDGPCPRPRRSRAPRPPRRPSAARLVLVEAPRAQKDAAPDELRAPERRPAPRAAAPRPAPSRPARSARRCGPGCPTDLCDPRRRGTRRLSGARRGPRPRPAARSARPSGAPVVGGPAHTTGDRRPWLGWGRGGVPFERFAREETMAPTPLRMGAPAPRASRPW